MDEHGYRVLGRVTHTDSAVGVHGLLVEVFDTGQRLGDRLGSARTRADGSFALTYREADISELIDQRSRIVVRVRDRDGAVVYTASEGHAYRPGQTARFDIALDDQALADHLKRPLSWAAPTGPLLPRAMLDQIEAAIGLLAPPGEPGHEAMRRAGLCPIPAIDAFDHLLDDAWATLQGDRDAVTRFRDTVELLAARRAPDGAGPIDEHDAMFRLIADDPLAGLDRLIERAGDAPGRGGLLPNDRVLPLVMATLQVSIGQPGAVGGPLSAVLEQVCQAEGVGVLHRAAVMALRGGEVERGHLRGLLDVFGEDCGPGDLPPAPETPPRHRPRCPLPMPDRDRINCIRETVQAWQAAGPTYVVSGVSPARACPGTTISITGRDFGPGPGSVQFGRRGGGWITVTPATWTDTRITVVVPNDASCRLNLIAPFDTVEVCGRFIDRFRPGRLEVDFDGAAPEILGFTVNARRGRFCVEPRSNLRIDWATCAADRVRIEVRDEAGAILDQRDPAGAFGHFLFSPVARDRTQQFTAHIVAEGACTPPRVEETVQVTLTRAPQLSVQGLEVTQSLQYYRADQHLTDAADRGPTNSLPLVVGKPAWVRVYLRSGQIASFDAGLVTGVTGTLQVERQVGQRTTLLATLMPAPTGATVTAEADPPYATERGTLAATLNFVIPGALMSGRLRLRAAVTAPPTSCGAVTASGQVTVDVTLRQTLNVAGILIGYNGAASGAAGAPNLTLAAPTLANLITTAGLTYTIDPVAPATAANFRVAATYTQTQPLTDPQIGSGGCSARWNALLGVVQQLATADGNQATWTYYGLMATGIPTGPVIGCGGSGSGAGAVGGGLTMVHELGHALGLQHAPCNVSGDPSFPAYEPYDSASVPGGGIGEYGLDITNGTIHPPTTDFDYMAYCGPKWISLYHYRRLLNVARLSPRTTPAGTGGPFGALLLEAETPPQPLISIIGLVEVDDRVTVTSVARLLTRPIVLGGQRTDLTAELLDTAGRLLASAPVQRISTRASGRPCGCDGDDAERPPYPFQALIPDVAPGAALRIRRGERELWRRAAPDTPPTIDRVTAQRTKDGRLRLTWQATTASAATSEILVRWSEDGGRTWRALTTGLTGAAATLDISHLPSGKVVFQVIISDGFSTAARASRPVTIPARLPTLAILSPQAGTVTSPGGVLRLWGVAGDAAGRPLADEACRWHIDGRAVGVGSDLWVESPGGGTHTVTFLVTDSTGTSDARVEIRVVGADETSA